MEDPRDRNRQRPRWPVVRRGAERPFRCVVCGMGFTQKISLGRHLQCHTGEKPHGCPYCPKRFNQKCNLERHVRCHTGERPFQCNFCPKTFNSKSNLSRHETVHLSQMRFWSELSNTGGFPLVGWWQALLVPGCGALGNLVMRFVSGHPPQSSGHVIVCWMYICSTFKPSRVCTSNWNIFVASPSYGHMTVCFVRAWLHVQCSKLPNGTAVPHLWFSVTWLCALPVLGGSLLGTWTYTEGFLWTQCTSIDTPDHLMICIVRTWLWCWCTSDHELSLAVIVKPCDRVLCACVFGGAVFSCTHLIEPPPLSFSGHVIIYAETFEGISSDNTWSCHCVSGRVLVNRIISCFYAMFTPTHACVSTLEMGGQSFSRAGFSVQNLSIVAW